MDAYMALKVYASGQSQPDQAKPARTWQPVAASTDALEEAFELSFGSVEPNGRRLLVAVDASGSMYGSAAKSLGYGMGFPDVVTAGSRLGTPYEVANTMAVMLARTERGNVHVIEVDTEVHPSRRRRGPICARSPPGGRRREARTCRCRSRGPTPSGTRSTASSCSPITRRGPAGSTRSRRSPLTVARSTRPPGFWSSR
jgi:hypothetical protein